MPLREVDKVEILTVLDNPIDMLMASTPQVRRLSLPPDARTRESLVAEHNFAALMRRECLVHVVVIGERHLREIPSK
jgi:hypothetical protein